MEANRTEPTIATIFRRLDGTCQQRQRVNGTGPRPPPVKRYFRRRRGYVVRSKNGIFYVRSATKTDFLLIKKGDAMPKKPAELIAKTIPQLAEYLGLATRTVSEYLALGLPGERGNYNVGDAEQWLIERRRMVQEREAQRRAAMKAETRQRRREQQLARAKRHQEYMRQANARLGIR